MTYPRLLNLDEETAAKLKTWLNTEIEQHRAERSQYDDQLVAYNQDYWAEPAVKEKTFPFKGACSIIIPLSAIAVEAIHASIMTTMFGMPDFLNVTVRDPTYADNTRAWEDYANYELTEKIKLRKKIEPAYLCLEKFGNGIAKSYYNNVTKYAIKEIGGEEVEIPVTIYDGADIASVHPSRFLMPFSSQDPQTAPWCGEVREANTAELEVMEQSGLFYEGVAEKLKDYWTSMTAAEDKVQNAQDQNEKRVPIVWNVRQNWYEIWTDFDVDGTSRKKGIQIFYHYDAQLLMAVRYNTYSNLRRPYRCGVYIPVENRWAGIGICKQNDQFQLEVTIQHRQRIDNATIANIRMFKVAKMSGYGPKEPIFPGKMWFLDDMKDIEAFQIGEVYPSSYNNEQQAVLYSQQRTGVNELTLGMPQYGTPGTATSDMSRVQESRKKSDYVLHNIKQFTLDVVYDTFDIIQTFGPRDVKYLATNDPLGEVQQILSLPTEAVRDALIFKLNISGQSSNQILDQQNWQQIAGFTQQYWTQMLNLAQGSGNPQLVQELTNKAMLAGTETFKQLLSNFNVKNLDRMLLDPRMLIGAQNGPSQQLLDAGGSGGVETAEQPAGMGGAQAPPQ